MERENRSELKRELGLLDAVGIGLGAVIGAGIFVVTGVAAGVAGPAFLVSMIIAGLAAIFNGLSSAQLASVYSKSGGTYEYGYQLLSPIAGFSAGWMFLVSKLAAGGVVALGFGFYLSQLLPVISPNVAAGSAVAFLTFANYFGIKRAGTVNLVIVSITLLSLLFFIVAGIPSVDKTNLTPFAPMGFSRIAEAAALLFFAFTGYARITTLGEEVREPKKTIPKAVIITLALSIFLYSAVALVAVGNVDYIELSSTSSPLVLTAAKFNIPGAVLFVGVGAATAMLGVLLSQILGISRMMFAMSRKNDLPAVLSKVHSTYNVPHVGILLSGAVIILLSIFGTIQFIVSAASFTILVYYSITNVAAIRLSKEHRLYPVWISICGLIFCVSMALSLEFKIIKAGILLLGLGYALLGFKKF